MYKTQILEARVAFCHQPFKQPLLLSSGPITEISEARAEVRVRVNGREATGRGSIYLSDLWAWPEPSLTHAQREARLQQVCGHIAADLGHLCGGEPEHPLELGLRLHHAICFGAPTDGPSILALAMCASPFDAAIHDAVGLALGMSAFGFYAENTPIPSADSLFVGGRASQAIAHTLQAPKLDFDAWLIVSRGDSLEDAFREWVRERKYHAFKVKILAQDNADDAARTAEVYRAARSFGVAKPRITVDSNEANPDAASVLDYLERLRSMDSDAFDALEYLEQPTARDIIANPNDWRAITRLKPVMLDEGLTRFDVLGAAVAQGWGGLALKTCKGHSFALTAAAWAREYHLAISLQDLTNPGFSAIHAALFAAHIPTVNGLELNSPQYTPAANNEWLPRLHSLLDPRDGTHRLPQSIPEGLGSRL